MVGFIIIGHNEFGKGLYNACSMIAGEKNNTVTVDFLPGDDIDILDGKINNALSELICCDEILVLADLAGGSPYNRSLVLSVENTDKNIHVVGGINLPLLIEAFCQRDMGKSAEEIVKDIMNLRCDSIIYGNEMLKVNM